MRKFPVKACFYCGRENDGSAPHCRECGSELRDLAGAPPGSIGSPKSAEGFFRWAPTALALWVLGLAFWGFAIANVWLFVLVARRGPSFEASQNIMHALLRGALGDGVIGVLCISGWHLMRRKTPKHLLIGIGAVVCAFFIASTRWMYWEVRGMNPYSWIEPLLGWPCLAYAAMYGFSKSRTIGGARR